MPPSEQIDPRTSMAAYFAYEIRRHRELRGLSQEQLAKELFSTRATIQAYESQRRRPGPEFAKELDQFFGTDLHFRTLWFHAQREHLKQWLEKYVHHEAQAIQIKTFQPLLVPGLLQTPDYARAVLAAGRGPADEDLVRARLERQAIITREAPPAPLIWVVLDEAALLRPMGGRDVMVEQLAHLLDLMRLSNVTIQVVPLAIGAYHGTAGGFQILTVEGRDIAYADAHLGGRLIEEDAEVEHLKTRYDWIRARALSVDATADLITRTMERFRNEDRVA